MEHDPRLVADRDRPGAWLVRSEGTDQSHVDPADPTYLEFYYVQRMADVIDTAFAPGQRISAIHVGGAGMTLPRYIAHTRPTSAQIILEPDAALTEAVRQAAPLPRRSGIKVRPVDGLTGLTALRNDYADLVVVDAFQGAQVPAELATTQWFAQVKRVLHQDGTMVMNATDRTPLTYTRRLVAGLAESFTSVIVGAEPTVLRGRRFGNLIVIGGHCGIANLERKARTAAFPFRLIHGAALKRWLGNAKPFTTLDAEPSPAPPSGWMGLG